MPVRTRSAGCHRRSCSRLAAPDGTPYYYHKVSNTSTYTRPVLPGASAVKVSTLRARCLAQHAQDKPPKAVKEKPKSKRPVPGTEWLRVETTQGNVFWTHTGLKTSSWTVPDDIAELVARLDSEGWDAREEVERVKAELKRKANDDDGGEKDSKRARVDDGDDKPRPKKLKPDEAAAQALGVDKEKVSLSPEEARALFLVRA